MTPKEQKAKELVKKLKAHADSAGKIGNAKEAATFAAKAIALADKYGFTLAEIEERNEDDLNIFPWEEVKGHQRFYAAAIAKLYGVCPIIHKRKNRSSAFVYLSGTQEAIDMSVHIFQQTIDNMELTLKLEINKVKDLGASTTYVKKFKMDFYRGLAYGIRIKTEEARQNYSPKLTELMALSKEKGLEHFERVNGIECGTTGKAKIGARAFNAGKSAADNVVAGTMIGKGGMLLNA